ncbi:hypothetical protein T4C_7497, partial [Trichinella pseudospiralis]
LKKINVQCNTNNEIKSGINEFCEMANMPGVVLEIFKASGGWRDQKWAPPRSVKLPSLRQGRMQTLPCSLGRWSARFPTLEREKPRLSALKRWMCGEFNAFPLLPGEGRLCVLPAQQSEGEGNLPCSLGRWSARFPTLERGKPRLSALKRYREWRIEENKNADGSVQKSIDGRKQIERKQEACIENGEEKKIKMQTTPENADDTKQIADDTKQIADDTKQMCGMKTYVMSFDSFILTLFLKIL